MALIHKATLIPPKLKLLTAWLPSRSCWVYDGCGDPVWATALATTMLTGGTQAGEFVDMGGRLEAREATATVMGSGTAGTQVREIDAVTCHDEGLATVIRADMLELVVVRVVGAEVSAVQTLTGRWAGAGPAVLAGLRPPQRRSESQPGRQTGVTE